MAIEITGKFKPKGVGYALLDAEDVEMPDGTRLSEYNLNMKLKDGVSEIQPDTYYIFGEVSTLAVTLAEVDDGKAHEYCFEFVAADDFDGFSITPAPKWTTPVQVVPGKTHQVSVLRGIGVIICA